MADWKKTEQLYEGKAKKVFATNDPDLVIVDYKDDATAFNGEKKGTTKRLSSMEAYGLFVSDICTRSGLAYNYGPRTMTYTSCVLYNKE